MANGLLGDTDIARIGVVVNAVHNDDQSPCSECLPDVWLNETAM